MTNDQILDLTVREYLILSGYALAPSLKDGLQHRMPDVYYSVNAPDLSHVSGKHKLTVRLKVTAVSATYLDPILKK